MVEENEEILNDIYLTIHNSHEISSQDNFLGFCNMCYKNKNDLIINVMMFDVIMEKITFDEVLNNYFKIKSIQIIEKQFILFNTCYNVNDVNIRNKTVKWYIYE